MPYPKIPNGPLTITFNGLIMDHILDQFAAQYLPAYDLEFTSTYRNPQKNKEEGGAEHSAHLYNLARDFVLKRKTDGSYISAAQLKKVYTEFIAPFWPGYSYYGETKQVGGTGWIHVNLPRELTNKTRIADWAVTGLGLFFTARTLYKKFKRD